MATSRRPARGPSGTGERAAPRPSLALAVCVLLLAGCTTLYRNHGYVPNDADLATIRVGVTTRDEVAQSVGRPTSTGLLDADGWYYVQSRFRDYAYLAPREIDREVVVISFGSGGRVANVERFGLEQGRVVALSRRVTESNVQGIGFLRQMFGNIGNLEAGELLQ